ncbi:MAG: ferredoxin family protein [Planctomycetota bacterium]|nr:ferredoxin family protein [Planctomycetota bacterium]
MSVLTHTKLRILLFEGEGSLPLQNRSAILRALLEKGYNVSRVTTGSSPNPEAIQGPILVLGAFKDAPPSESTDDSGKINVYFRDIQGKNGDAIIDLVEGTRDGAAIPKPGGWKPWFPVIDYDRCTDCMQCLSFCLFDVYGVDDKGSIVVQNQDNCKTDCPACSRVCPDVAIMFPKYRHGPMNGAEVKPEDVQREAMKIDISALLGGDIYSALRNRSAKARSRFSKERDDERALKERKKCLNKLKDTLDIPMEVLGALPSLDQIKQRAEEAKLRAEKAIQEQNKDS